MVEQVEKRPQGMILGADPVVDPLGVGEREHSQLPDESHEIDGHSRLPVLGPVERMDLARRKHQRGVAAENGPLPPEDCRSVRPACRSPNRSSRRTVWKNWKFQGSGGDLPRRRAVILGFLSDASGSSSRYVVDYIRTLRPALGGHSRRISFLCLVDTTSWLKLFTVQYRPRKYSMTLANR